MLKSEEKKFVQKAGELLREVLGEAGIAVLDKTRLNGQLVKIGKLYEEMNKEEEIL